MLGNLGESLSNSIKKLAGMTVIDKKTVKEVVKDIQRALIQSDVNVKLVFKLSKKIEDRALNEKPPKGITAREYVITIIYEEMVNLLGSESAKLEITDKPFKILFLGLQGSGKTTTIGKLCKYLIKKGYNPAVVCTDTWRPAAYEQLRQLTTELDISLYGDPENKDALDLAKKGLEKFKNQRIIIFDTAGRHKQESDLIEEMNKLDKIINPSESILVIDGTIGQIAGEQAKAFSEATDIGSIIISKLDGSGKGGGALSAVAETGAPIKFIGTGEKIDDFEVFDPERFISRLLGMGDIQSLIEKAEENIDEDIAQKTMNNMMSGKFTLVDMQNQFEMMNKMGPMQQVMNLIPGLGNKIPKEYTKMTEDKINTYKIIMSSMTQEEMENPRIIKQSRIQRIARGAGVEEKDIKELLKYYNNSKKAMKGIGKRGGFGGGNMARLMNQFGRRK